MRPKTYRASGTEPLRGDETDGNGRQATSAVR
jgi:hypothetical protein